VRSAARTEAELGPVSILVNNAGVSSPATLDSYDPAAMARMRRVNVDGVIHTIRAVAPGMQERGYGRIVNIASNAAIGTALPATTFEPSPSFTGFHLIIAGPPATGGCHFVQHKITTIFVVDKNPLDRLPPSPELRCRGVGGA
jgi:NAD(P)-dependent dehydrogenase (short-subunit alcohol dehydrogenase family)